MQSTFNDPLVMTSTPSTPTAPRPTRVAETGHSYRVSSYELRAGLEVAALAVDSLPADVLREFQRLRGCWVNGPGLASPGASPLLLRRAGVVM
jgi:hypothetical protein